MPVYLSNGQLYKRNSGVSISPEVALVLARMSNLSPTEISAITAFVDGQLLAGNWQIMDEFYCFCLNVGDSLTGFLANTATTNGTMAHSLQAGWESNDAVASAGYIDTAIDYSTQTNYIVSPNTGMYLINDTANTTQNWDLFRAQSTSPNASTAIRYRGTDTIDWNVFCNSGNGTIYVQTIAPHTLYSTDRGITDQNFYIDALLVASDAFGGASIPTGRTCYVLGGNNDGTANHARLGSTGAFYCAGATGFNHASFLTGLRQLLIDLGVTGVPTP